MAHAASGIVTILYATILIIKQRTTRTAYTYTGGFFRFDRAVAIGYEYACKELEKGALSTLL
ncbi:MAG: hypothetical protein ACNYPI_08210 [Arenicellales bacterium WSBS_2016_MAG_OTU3]